ncbi:MAG: nucleoside-triphosphatase [Candidatus Korarchaeota archaeon]|nr:nucleoside-triphosphatase [Thermoproteota archaeon]
MSLFQSIKNIFIAGPPRSGKSTLLMSILEDLQKDKIRISGIICPEIRVSGKRWGFKVKVYPEGPEEILASVEIQSPYRVSKYGVNIGGFERIVENYLMKMLKDPNVQVLLIDEIGKMELLSKKFRSFVEEALNSPKLVVGVLGYVDDPLVLSIRRRKDTVVYTITYQSSEIQRKEIRRKILEDINTYILAMSTGCI